MWEGCGKKSEKRLAFRKYSVGCGGDRRGQDHCGFIPQSFRFYLEVPCTNICEVVVRAWTSQWWARVRRRVHRGLRAAEEWASRALVSPPPLECCLRKVLSPDAVSELTPETQLVVTVLVQWWEMGRGVFALPRRTFVKEQIRDES